MAGGQQRFRPRRIGRGLAGLRLGGGEVGRGGAYPERQVGLVQPGEGLSGGDHLADFNEPRRDPAAGAEGDIGLPPCPDNAGEGMALGSRRQMHLGDLDRPRRLGPPLGGRRAPALQPARARRASRKAGRMVVSGGWPEISVRAD